MSAPEFADGGVDPGAVADDSDAAPKRPLVWSIAGSDSGAGAGVQADLRAFDAFGVIGCTAIAALTAQSSVAVERVEAVSSSMLQAQLDTLAADLPPAAIKTGLLGSVANMRCVAAQVRRLRRSRDVALVIDPVRRATTGAAFGGDELRAALLAELLPLADVVTPNRDEAAWLLGWDAASMSAPAQVERAAAALRARGAGAVVITGGDARGQTSDETSHSQALDFIDTPQARGWLAAPRIATPHHHGSGCVHASSLAAALALDFCAADAAVLAKRATTDAVRQGAAFGSGGAGAGAVRPRRGFALQRGQLPTLHDAAAAIGSSHPRFATPDAAPDAGPLGLYAIVDSADAVERVLAAGVRSVQLRIKLAAPAGLSAPSARDLSAQIARSVVAARRAGAQLFINDHWALAIEHGASGVHLGQQDISETALRLLRDAGLRVGLSTHSFWEVSRALAARPSYIACGPIHATTTKPMPWRPQGNANLAYWCHVLREPVVAIAGMDEVRAAQARRCGAAGIAVLRGIADAGTAPQRIATLQAAIAKAGNAPPLPLPELPRSTLGRCHHHGGDHQRRDQQGGQR